MKQLFIFEMANNHMGSLEHGLKLIQEFAKVKEGYDEFDFAIKFQFRNIDTFIHPDYKDRVDLKYVKRFTETCLTNNQFLTLKQEAEKLGFLTVCTGFDEESVGKIEEMRFPIIKIASLTGSKIVPLSYSVKNKFFLNSWDRFLLALPFNKGCFILGKPIKVKKNISIKDDLKLTKKLEKELINLTKKADQYYDH